MLIYPNYVTVFPVVYINHAEKWVINDDLAMHHQSAFYPKRYYNKLMLYFESIQRFLEKYVLKTKQQENLVFCIHVAIKSIGSDEHNCMKFWRKYLQYCPRYRRIIPEDKPTLIELLREFVSLSSSLSILLMSMSSRVISSSACSEILLKKHSYIHRLTASV